VRGESISAKEISNVADSFPLQVEVKNGYGGDKLLLVPICVFCLLECVPYRYMQIKPNIL